LTILAQAAEVFCRCTRFYMISTTQGLPCFIGVLHPSVWECLHANSATAQCRMMHVQILVITRFRYWKQLTRARTLRN